MKKKIALILAVVMLLTLVLAAIVAAQGTGGDYEPIVVEGRIQRPHAFYILQRASMEFGLQAKRRSFIRAIEHSIEQAPF
jgi:predicted small secreted protein